MVHLQLLLKMHHTSAANAICLRLAETAKANGIDFYKYLVTLMTELPNLPIQQQPEILKNYMPWSKKIQATCAK
ncbi:transposase domain-containing protein [Lysinibacillus sp. G4S2]|uniref:transposase domain-containing protein n=1 Tax=Lysinibacillus sp. G4S2 TaxID=3055859 RepID=UPI0025A2A8A9|nr:transposase domain-containing protein [Lysinibacillus sp. G4S2]MDM5250080.1 transposase domain-containing protein [Lysinibacillus sp. G4S2]